MNLWRRYLLLCRPELLCQSVDDLLILGGVFRIRGVLVMTGAAHEVRAFRMDARQRSRGDAVAVHIEVTREALNSLEGLGVQHLATVRTIRVIPRQPRHDPVVHADVEVRYD